jgi:hypothetical protein
MTTNSQKDGKIVLALELGVDLKTQHFRWSVCECRMRFRIKFSCFLNLLLNYSAFLYLGALSIHSYEAQLTLKLLKDLTTHHVSKVPLH